MPKLKLKIDLSSQEEKSKYELIGNLNKEKNILTYFEPTEEKTKVEYLYDENILRRSNSSLDMEYRFDTNKETEGIITVKDLNKTLYVKLKTIKLEINDHNIKIKFSVENQEFVYSIKVKEN
ncbi:MAG: hypothetical protein E7160_02605 [Firmicutes bacterium]|nr:hypothetical protein [Bacillota bacterium]